MRMYNAVPHIPRSVAAAMFPFPGGVCLPHCTSPVIRLPHDAMISRMRLGSRRACHVSDQCSLIFDTMFATNPSPLRERTHRLSWNSSRLSERSVPARTQLQATRAPFGSFPPTSHRIPFCPPLRPGRYRTSRSASADSRRRCGFRCMSITDSGASRAPESGLKVTPDTLVLFGHPLPWYGRGGDDGP